jgi:hypothetical protein
MVKFVDWTRQQAFVEPSDAKGQSRWLGGGQGMHFDLCQAARTVLMEEATPPWLSIRGQAKLDELRESLAWVRPGSTTVVHDDEESRWWTFGGARLNRHRRREPRRRSVCRELRRLCGPAQSACGAGAPARAGGRVGQAVSRGLPAALCRRGLEAQKFMDCVPVGLRRRVLEERLLARREIEWAAGVPIVDVRVAR